MIGYQRLGEVPAKHHIALRRPDGPDEDGCPVFYEHCLTRGGFDGPFSIAYRTHNPGAEASHETIDLPCFEPAVQAGNHLHRHHLPPASATMEGDLWEACQWLVGNDDIRIGSARPSVGDTGLVQNSDGDLLLFIHAGSGRLESELGSLSFAAQDYVWIPKGLIHRVVFDAGDVHVMVNECVSGLQVPSDFMNPVGQLKMDAPYTARDFTRPDALSVPQPGQAVIRHKRADRWTRRTLPHHPFDVVGWDGHLYPVAFNIKDYQPKTSTTHLPPPIHTTFLGGRGSFVVCSFVPRKVDYHPDAIPCPYPHSSYDCDEVLWYVEGDFTSRRGVGPGSMSLHPAGIPHAPQPGKYEASMRTERTDELAVMVDTFKPLWLSQAALDAEDDSYHGSWVS